MKNLFLSIICVLITIMNIKSQTWTTINYPYTSTVGFYSMSFPTSKIGYISGSDGRILKTINGGYTWDSLITNVNKTELHSVFFINENVGFAAGGKIIISTINGGASWTLDTTKVSDYIYDLYMASVDSGNIIGTSGLTMKYKNKVWSATNSLISSDLFSLCFTKPSTGYAVGGFFSSKSIIVKTSDGGATWQFKTTPNDNMLISIMFPTESTGYAVGWKGSIVKSIDNGENWSALTSGTTTLLNSVFFLDNKIGYSCGNTGLLLKTTNGGTSWSKETLSGNDLYCIKFINDTLGFIVGHNSILKYKKSSVDIDTQLLSKPQSLTNTIEIYPNPCTEYLTINSEKGNTLRIIDELGNVVFYEKEIFENIHTINVSKFHSGIYFLQVISNDKKQSLKFIKK